MKKTFVLLFLLLIALSALFFGCEKTAPEAETPPAQEGEVRYISYQGDILTLTDGNFDLQLAENKGSFTGTYIGQGQSYILRSYDKDFFISIEKGNLFSFIDIEGPDDVKYIEPAETCSHPEKTLLSYKAPTCTENGYTGDYVCTECGATVQKGAVMPAKGHFFTKETDVVYQKGYCTRNEERYYACAVCDALGTAENTYEVPNSASGQHSFTAISSVMAQAATCADNQLNYTACCVCGEVGISTIEVPGTATGLHDFSKPSTKIMYRDADCGHNAVYYKECSVCGLVSSDPNDTYEVPDTAEGTHDFSEPSGYVKKEATCLTDRVEYARCAVCGVVNNDYEVTVPGTATGMHVYTALSDIVASSPTCTQDRTVYSQCKYCGLVNRSKTLRVMATATGHTYDKHVCTECGSLEDTYSVSYDVSFNKNVDNVHAYLYTVNYKYDLVFYGTGKMESYTACTDAPWYDRYAGGIQKAYVYGISKIGDYALSQLSELTSVYFGGTTVTEIGHYVFYGCAILERLALPSSVTKIGYGAMSCCPELATVDLSGLTGLTSVGPNLFRDDVSLTSIDLSDTALTNLSSEMFSRTSLQEIVFPSSLEEIGSRCFFETLFFDVDLPETLVTLGSYAFADCTDLREVVFLGTNVRTIGDGAFSGDRNLSDIAFPSGITSIGKDILSDTLYYKTAANWSGSALLIGGSNKTDYLLNGLSEEDYFIVSPKNGDSPVEKGWYIREEGNGKVSYRLTENVEVGNVTYYQLFSPLQGSVTVFSVLVANGALEGCDLVTSVTLSTPTKYIGQDAFRHCMRLASVDFASVEKIGDTAFYGCAKLVSARIPATALSVGEYAFADCSSLRSFGWDWNGRENGSVYPAGILDNDNLFEIYCAEGASTFGAAVVHHAYSDPTVITSDDTFVYAYVDDQGYLIGCIAPEKTELILPDTFTFGLQTVDEYIVTERAFCQDSFYAQVKKLVLSSAITAIRDEAFYGCAYLTDVSFSLTAGAVRLEQIGKDVFGQTAFYNDTANWDGGALYLTYQENNDSVLTDWYILLNFHARAGVSIATTILRDRTTHIADSAFESSCSAIRDLTLKSYIRSIGKDALKNCTGLTDLTVPFVGRKTDKDNYLAYFFGGESYTGGDDYVQEVPQSLTTLRITNAERIAENELRGCVYLTKITFDVATKFETCALYGCTQAEIDWYQGQRLEEVDEYAFYGCKKMTEVSFSDQTTSIGQYAFYGTSIKELEITSGIETIGVYAFAENAYLHDLTLTIGENASIGANAFRNCIGLLSVTVGKDFPGVDIIGEDAFTGCQKLVEIINKSSCVFNSGSPGNIAAHAQLIHSGSESLIQTDSNDFKLVKLDSTYYILAYTGEDTVIELPSSFYFTDPGSTTPKNITSFEIYPYAFADNVFLQSVTFGPSITAIGNNAFENCTALSTVSFGSRDGQSKLKSIGQYAFKRSGVTSLAFPATLKSIEREAFYECEKLQTYTMESGIEEIRERAFYGCSKLRRISFPGSSQSIRVYSEAFAWCTAATELNVSTSFVPSDVRIFAECVQLTTVQWYSTSTVNQSHHLFENAGTEGSGMTVTFYNDVPKYIFAFSSGKMPNVKFLNFAEGVRTINEYAFANITTISNRLVTDGPVTLTLPSTLRTISEGAFSGCTSIQSITLPSSVTSVSTRAFMGCVSLSSFLFSGNLDSLSDETFSGCISLTTLAIPYTVRSIGTKAFYNCQALRYISLSGQIQTIASDAFSGCSSTMEAYVLGVKGGVSVPGVTNLHFVYFADNNDNVLTSEYAISINEQKKALLTGIGNVVVEYSTSDARVAKLVADENGRFSGMVEGIASGTATITARITISGLSFSLSYLVNIV